MGPKSENVEKALVFKAFFEGSKGPRGRQDREQVSEPRSFLAYGRTLEPYLRQFDVEKHEMASVMGICAGLVGPKSGNVEKVLVFKAFFGTPARSKKVLST